MRSRPVTSGGIGSSKSLTTWTTFAITLFLARMSNLSLTKRSITAAEVLRKDLAGRTDHARQKFGGVAGAGLHIQHLHPGLDPGEGQKLHRLAARVRLAIGVGAVGGGDHGGVIRRGARPARSAAAVVAAIMNKTSARPILAWPIEPIMRFPFVFGRSIASPCACYHGRRAAADAIVIRHVIRPLCTAIAIRLQDAHRTRPGGNAVVTCKNARLPYRDGHG